MIHSTCKAGPSRQPAAWGAVSSCNQAAGFKAAGWLAGMAFHLVARLLCGQPPSSWSQALRTHCGDLALAGSHPGIVHCTREHAHTYTRVSTCSAHSDLCGLSVLTRPGHADPFCAQGVGPWCWPHGLGARTWGSGGPHSSRGSSQGQHWAACRPTPRGWLEGARPWSRGWGPQHPLPEPTTWSQLPPIQGPPTPGLEEP